MASYHDLWNTPPTHTPALPPTSTTAQSGGCQQSGRPCDRTPGYAAPSRVLQETQHGPWEEGDQERPYPNPTRAAKNAAK
mmetsp:Transcript_39785/g.66130  ORF Transcript_39785/g.66130 Transcript_39785/m.66130 type:complete len:80 (-) Transcript_39785:13-252(-)